MQGKLSRRKDEVSHQEPSAFSFALTPALQNLVVLIMVTICPQPPNPRLHREDALEKGTATRSSVVAWRIPWTEEPGGAKVHGVTKSRTRLSGKHFHFHTVTSTGRLTPYHGSSLASSQLGSRLNSLPQDTRASRSHFKPHSLLILYTSRHPELQPHSITGCDFS